MLVRWSRSLDAFGGNYSVASSNRWLIPTVRSSESASSIAGICHDSFSPLNAPHCIRSRSISRSRSSYLIQLRFEQVKVQIYCQLSSPLVNDLECRSSILLGYLPIWKDTAVAGRISRFSLAFSRPVVASWENSPALLTQRHWWVGGRFEFPQ